MKIGWGYDIHPLRVGRKLVLGGVHIPFEKGLDGHSDADVLIHALCDALLGAAGQGDLGRLFPDTDPRFANIESSRLLRKILHETRVAEFDIHHVDSTIIAQRPKLVTHLPRMEEGLAGILEVERERINIKATSPEGIGAIGREEAIAAQCVVLMEPKKRESG